MISILIGFREWQTKATADYPQKDKITVCLEDRENKADVGHMYIDLSFDKEKIIVPDTPNKFGSVDELADALGKLVSFDYGKYNGNRYGKSFDKLS